MLIFRQLFDATSSTYTYLLADHVSGEALLIDPVYEQARRDAALVGELGLQLAWTLETHVHADHLSAAPYLQERLGGKIGIGEKITVVQETFGKVFNEGTRFRRDGSQFDRLFREGAKCAGKPRSPRHAPPTSTSATA